MVKKNALLFLVCFLCFFMLSIFGPAEIFFSNTMEFGFVYREFAGFLAGAGIIATIIFSLIGIVLPACLKRIYLSLIFGMGLMAYFQVMFLNKQLDLLGINPNGYEVPLKVAIGNLIIWILALVALVAFAFCKKELWEKIVFAVSLFLRSEEHTSELQSPS